ncbi:kinase-like protein [Aspergillus sclerotiicarbonarius CBS 121057]|uniref:Kinase-like protein n=1 Tax=Aspergillus sclerotiicarbonarius (strain CBS 121057 / IBT 28362) TaxID=1448318 RepID=A0A319EC66_ASPSB|nr:kinase-like protein [Aspergillus sclerotiicarbonarius CBS 121057]
MMLKLIRPFMWRIWSTVWNLIALPISVASQFWLWLGRVEGPSIDTNTSTSSNPFHITVEEHRITVPPGNGKLLKIGIFAEVYLKDDAIVRKVPRSNTHEDSQPILREAMIYSILGKDPRIAECLSLGQTDFVDTKYYSNGDLAAFISDQIDKLDFDLQRKWFRQIIEAVNIIHKHGVIHSDLALRQFFLDDDLNARLGDFNSAQYPGHVALGYEEASHCLPRDYEAPNSVTSDLFALGSTLYELSTGKTPYSELYQTNSQDHLHSGDHSVIRARIQREQQADQEIENRYRNQKFPDVNGLWGESIILGCWKGTITTAEEALNICVELEN